MAECHPVLMRKINSRKEQDPAGVTVIVADSPNTVTGRQADLHLQFLPGTDLALVNAMAQVLVSGGFADEEFLKQHVTFHRAADDKLSLADCREFPQDCAPEKATPVCGVSAEKIREADRGEAECTQCEACIAACREEAIDLTGVRAAARVALQFMLDNEGERLGDLCRREGTQRFRAWTSSLRHALSAPSAPGSVVASGEARESIHSTP